MKDKNPISGEEVDDYTVEFECIADDAGKLAQELAKCPLGERAMALLDRAEFLPKDKPNTVEDIKREAEEEDKARLAREEELKEEGRKEVREKYIEYLKKKRATKKELTEIIEKDEEEAEKRAEEAEQSEERNQESQDFPSDGNRSIMPSGFGVP
jgi:hypothetical protein